MSAITGEKRKTSYFREVQNELRKVSWTSKQELIFCTKTVIISTFVFGLTIYVIDLGIRGCLDSATNIVQRIFG